MYNPIADFTFPNNQCFLSGEISDTIERIPVFPEWLMKRYDLWEKEILMLAENKEKYKDIRVPCADRVNKEYVLPLEREIQQAFEGGFEQVKKIPELRLFQWMAKLMYGVLYNDMKHAILQLNRKDKVFRLSPLLTKKFTNLHCFLQSLLFPMEFENTVPWSICIFRVNYSKDVFNYKDETKNINFSLGMNDFGLVACLQDNGANKTFHKDILARIGEQRLHPVQFEEICARFLYSNYLLQVSGNYHFEKSCDFIKVSFVPDTSGLVENAFGLWDDKTYSQVLANYWKPWGLTTRDIYSFPNSPISYLINEYTNELIAPDSITLPG